MNVISYYLKMKIQAGWPNKILWTNKFSELNLTIETWTNKTKTRGKEKIYRWYEDEKNKVSIQLWHFSNGKLNLMKTRTLNGNLTENTKVDIAHKHSWSIWNLIWKISKKKKMKNFEQYLRYSITWLFRTNSNQNSFFSV